MQIAVRRPREPSLLGNPEGRRARWLASLRLRRISASRESSLLDLVVTDIRFISSPACSLT